MILGGGMAELTATLNEVDEEANILYKKLETLGDDIRNETEVFEQTKQLELDLFLQSQNIFQNEVVMSKKRVQNTTDTLRNVVQGLEEEADIITALALFPLKSVDKKAAFVVGLALALKLPFDTVKVAFNSLDISDWFGVAVQAGVCLACMNHYGILKALGKKPPIGGIK